MLSFASEEFFYVCAKCVSLFPVPVLKEMKRRIFFNQHVRTETKKTPPVFISTFIPFLILGLLFKDFFTQSEQIEPVWPQAAQLGIYFSNIALTVRYDPN